MAKQTQETGRQPKARVQIVINDSHWEWMVTQRRLDGSEILVGRGQASDWPAASMAASKKLKEIGVKLSEK